MESLAGSANIWASLITLTALEIVLGIDNIIFISILSGKLPKEKQPRARIVGLAAAMLMRILLLLSISWVIGLTQPLFHFIKDISGRDLILLGGGLFLIAKSTFEIHEKLEGEESAKTARAASFIAIIVQIMLLDAVFSLDSVITAVGLSNVLWVMITAIVVSVLFMMLFSGVVSNFVHRHPTIKMLALSFLLLIGVTLVADGAGHQVPHGYIYFAMAFSVFVEMLNLRLRHKSSKIELHEPHV